MARQPIESLESRVLFIATQTFADGVLHIVMNPGNDRVRILQHPGTTLIGVNVRREPYKTYEGVTLIRVEGLTGQDTMYLGGNLTVPAFMDGGPGRDIIIGAHGNDTLLGGQAGDYIDGGPGDDSIVGGSHNDRIDGGEGNDSIDAGAGNDRVNGGAGDDVILGGGGRDVIDAGDGNDRILGGAANDILTGGAGADTFSQTDRNRELRDLATDDLRTGA